TLADGVARIVVAAATHRDLEALASSERDRARDVVRIRTLRDDGGAAIDLAVPDAAGGVVAVVARRENDAGDTVPEGGQRRIGECGHRWLLPRAFGPRINRLAWASSRFCPLQSTRRYRSAGQPQGRGVRSRGHTRCGAGPNAPTLI